MKRFFLSLVNWPEVFLNFKHAWFFYYIFYGIFWKKCEEKRLFRGDIHPHLKWYSCHYCHTYLIIKMIKGRNWKRLQPIKVIIGNISVIGHRWSTYFTDWLLFNERMHWLWFNLLWYFFRGDINPHLKWYYCRYCMYCHIF